MKYRIIGVIGASTCSQDVAQIAENVGKNIAKMGAILICGGLGGVMEASSKGAKEQGGVTVGILPGFSIDQANPYIDIPIATNMGHARNTIITQTADVLIAISGEYGTLSEIAIGLKLGKPVYGLGSWPSVTGIKQISSVEELFQRLTVTSP